MNREEVAEKSPWTLERIAIWIMIGILILALSLRLGGLDAKSVWQDEIFTAAIASTENSVSQVLSIPLHNSAVPKPGLYFLITHSLLYVADNDFVLRFPAVLFGVLGVAITYSLGARLLGRREGLGGAFLLSISSLHIRYSQDARFYTLLLFLSLLSLYFLYRGILENEGRWWIGFTICSILNVYNHHIAFLVLLAETVLVAGLWAAQALSTRKRSPSAGEAAHLSGKVASSPDQNLGLSFVVSLAVIAMTYVPMLSHLLRGLGGPKGLGGTATRGMSLTASFLTKILDAWGIGSGWAVLVLFIPFLIGTLVAARDQRGQLWVLFCWLVVPFAVLFGVPAQHSFRPRYVLFMLPLYLLFVARGLTAASELIRVRWPGRRLRLQDLGLVAFLTAIALLSATAVHAYYVEDRVDWRSGAALLARSISPGEVIASPGPFAQVALPRYEESLGEVDFIMGGSEVFFSLHREPQVGVWFVSPQEEEMSAIESELSETMSSYFKVVFEVDDQRVARAGSLQIAPAMYKDLWILYFREDL